MDDTTWMRAVEGDLLESSWQDNQEPGVHLRHLGSTARNSTKGNHPNARGTSFIVMLSVEEPKK